MRILSFFLLIAVVLFGANPARACDVPVFRYALERWPADDYIACVFHDAPLTGEQAAAVELLRSAAVRKDGRANLKVELVDTTGKVPGEYRVLRESMGKRPLPCIVLRPPPGARYGGAVWSGDLNAGNARLLVDSSLRRALAERIIAGDAAVWVLRESGNRALDRAAADSLGAVLEDLKRRPILTRGRNADPGDAGHTATFSLIRLPAGKAGEAVFDALFLHVEPDLGEYADEPMAIPVFGRGRALYALTGGGITAANIRKACRFVTGDCSCEVKDLNPGVDLLLAADWERGIGESWVDAVETPPLVGLPEIPAARTTPETPRARASADSLAGTAPKTASITPETSPAASPAESVSVPADPAATVGTGGGAPGRPGGMFGFLGTAIIAAFLAIIVIVALLTLRLGAIGRKS